MNVDEPENAAESSKREPKPIAKELAVKMEGLQRIATLCEYQNLNAGYDEVKKVKKVSTEELERHDGRLWYIPHHGVYHPKKQKIRVVFDCGASYQGTLLNEHLLQGPDLTSPLVKVHPNDCDLLRFLWWPVGNIDGDLKEYRMVVHLFGATSSPSCSSFAMRRCAEDHKDLYDAKTIDVVFNNFYVDNCLVSVPTNSDAVQLYQRLTEMVDFD
ncbi:uncharacterized protein LOC117805176 [Tachysurus ichikawai]